MRFLRSLALGMILTEFIIFLTVGIQDSFFAVPKAKSLKFTESVRIYVINPDSYRRWAIIMVCETE